MTWFNKTWLEFTGRSSADEVGSGWCEAVHPDDRLALESKLAEALERQSGFTAMFRLRRADGAYRWIASEGRSVTSQNGRFEALFGYCSDVTERKEEEDKLLAAMMMQALLLDEIRHRVRNNMQVVVAFVDLLNRQFASEAKPNMDQMMLRIRALARMQQYFYASAERVQNVELAAFLQRFADDFARDSRLPVHVEVRGNDVLVDVGQATSIGLAVTETLLNAADPTRSDTDIRIALSRSAAQLMISIERLHGFAPDKGVDAAMLRLLQLYAKLISGIIEVSDDSTKIVLRLAA